MAENMGKGPSGHGQLTKIRLSDGCGGKAITTAAQFEYDCHAFEGYLGNVGSTNGTIARSTGALTRAHDAGCFGTLRYNSHFLTRLPPAPAMPEPRFSGSSTLQLSYFRFKIVPRRSSPPSIVTRPPRDAPVGPGGACCRRGSSTRSAPSPAPARHYAPASRPCRCSGPRRHARRGPEPTNGSCCLASRARSTACCGGPCDGSGSATPSRTPP